jgi:hypothetical protein
LIQHDDKNANEWDGKKHYIGMNIHNDPLPEGFNGSSDFGKDE